MAVFRKLYQPLWFWNGHINVRHSVMNGKKIIPLNLLIEKNVDICNKIQNESPSNAEWQDIRDRILQNDDITEINVDSTIIDICLKESNADKAIAYIKYLKENNYPMSTAIIGKYLRLFHFKQDSLTEADKTEILSLYNALREKHPYLDSVTAEHCIVGLTLTDQWKKAYELVDMLKMYTVPSKTIYSSLSAAAFRNNEPAMAWEAIQNIVSCKQNLSSHIYKSHLQFCEQGGEQTFDCRMEDMFKYLAENGLIPHVHAVNKYVDTANNYGWSTSIATISKTGKCTCCGHSLSKIVISEEAFQKLTTSIMNKLIIGPDIYHKTSPYELQKFKQFIERTKPYDIVIDGLNVTYYKRNYYARLENVSPLKTLIEVVRHFRKQRKKILVLTRHHQQKMPDFKYLQEQAYIFMTNNLSSDDSYLLYATMASGKDTMFVSMDLMRQHKYLLQDVHLQWEFRKWQLSHQYFINMKSHDLYLQGPFTFMPTAQKNSDIWHIPTANTEDAKFAFQLYDFPEKWYCFQKKEKER